MEERTTHTQRTTQPLSADLYFAILRAGGQELRVGTEAEAEHCSIHHHEALQGLVLQVLRTHARSTHTHTDKHTQ